MASPEKNCKWHFDIQTAASQDVGPNDSSKSHFDSTPYPSLIRESIQNSLDVVNDHSKPLRMEFTFGKIRSSGYPNFFELKHHIIGVNEFYGEAAAAEYGKMAEILDNKQDNQKFVNFIKVSDYNTVGMRFAANDPSAPFYAFVRSIGVSSKPEKSSGGSFGFGKAAYFLMSPIHTVFVSTLTKEGEYFFEGAAKLCTHYQMTKNEDGGFSKVLIKDSPKKLQHFGYYDSTDGNGPINDPHEIPGKFLRDAELGAGTDIFIMGINGADEAKDQAVREMAEAVLRNFWLAIYDEKLEVVIKDNDTVLCEINKTNLDDKMGMYFQEELDTKKSNDEYNPRPYYETVRDIEHNKDCTYKEATLPILGTVKLYVRKDNDALPSTIYMRKQRMYIYRDRKRSGYGYISVFLCDDLAGNVKLKNCEDPSHTIWDKNKGDGKNILKEIDRFIGETINDLFASAGNGPLSIDGLEEYLSIPEDLLKDKEDNDADNPFFGTPSGETTDEEGASPTSEITTGPKIQDSEKGEELGNITIETSTAGRPQDGGSFGGNKRGKGKKKRKGANAHPGHVGYGEADAVEDSDLITNVPVRYRVIAEWDDGKLFHTIIMFSDVEVDNGMIELIVGGEDKDEKIDIIETSNGSIVGNTIRKLHIKIGKNEVRLRFDDNMKHPLKLTAYEID